MSPTASSIARSFFTHFHHHNHHNQIHSMDGHDSPESDPDLSFDRHVSSHLLSLLPSRDQIQTPPPPPPFLSLSWIHSLLSSFLLLLNDSDTKLPNCPSLKSLDLLNAVRDGLDRVRHIRLNLDTALSSLEHNHLLRATKALTLISPFSEDPVGPTTNHRHHHHRSFSLRPHHHPHHNNNQLRTLSWNVSVSRNWSASHQLSAISTELSSHKHPTTMSWLLYLVLWTLVAAVPCQDGGGVHANAGVPLGAMAGVMEKVVEEARRKGNEKASGLMREICVVENGARRLLGLLKEEGTEERREEVVKEMESARKGLDGLEGLDRLVREIFLRIARSRIDGLEFMPH